MALVAHDERRRMLLALCHREDLLPSSGWPWPTDVLAAAYAALQLERQALCGVCGAGPTGRCDPPDDFNGECPHGCSPER